MQTLTVRLYADGLKPMRTEGLAVFDAAEAREWANDKVRHSQIFTRAQIYSGETLLSEIGYRINRLAD